MARNPPWSRDELILALDLYIRHGGDNPKPNEVAELSSALQRLAVLTGAAGENFRNASSVRMKLGNFQSIDPAYKRAGKVGLPRGGRPDRLTWDEFAHNPRRLRSAAEAIRTAIDLAPSWAHGEPADDIIAAPEGRLLTRLHRYRERDQALRENKVSSVLKTIGHLQCEVCAFDFERAYGERGAGFIEVHHLAPLSSLVNVSVTRLEDLALAACRT